MPEKRMASMATVDVKDLAISTCRKCSRRGLISRKTGFCTGTRMHPLHPKDEQQRSVRCEAIAAKKAA